MARYIDAEKIDLKIPFEYAAGEIFVDIVDVKKAIAQTPTEDVVPKSEFDEVLSNWQKIHDSYTADCLEHYNRGRTEVAREIERIMATNNAGLGIVKVSTFVEVKKKYTEGNDAEKSL
jgi:hypothetical protein